MTTGSDVTNSKIRHHVTPGNFCDDCTLADLQRTRADSCRTVNIMPNSLAVAADQIDATDISARVVTDAK
eukprot:CAMPEP_0118927836 /NCGR_PEP_ID=MMETSP1169-20130426/5222_1 /TAXON_ID=36882 /ORGANISM="Pyramimonas obovata, Strain CCMP722" /LENGTH=69 /DNA_ID=CAMNT_0006869683 /DNA_START=920 /DNA_END=1129 /DNA_ORIENTATION=+